MRSAYITFTIQSIILVLVQAVIMNHVRLFGFFTPIIFIYPLLKLPLNTPKWTSVLLGALLGFSIDLLMNTPGLNLSVCSLIGLIRTPILLSLADDDILEDEGTIIVPTFTTLGSGINTLYLFIIVAIQIATLMLLEAFSVEIFTQVIPNIIGSIAVSYIIIILFDIFLIKKKG